MCWWRLACPRGREFVRARLTRADPPGRASPTVPLAAAFICARFEEFSSRLSISGRHWEQGPTSVQCDAARRDHPIGWRLKRGSCGKARRHRAGRDEMKVDVIGIKKRGGATGLPNNLLTNPNGTEHSVHPTVDRDEKAEGRSEGPRSFRARCQWARPRGGSHAPPE